MYNQRTDYKINDPLNIETMEKDPFNQFQIWYKDALAYVKKDPNAMVLGTYDGEVPRTRVVLLKELDQRGFTYFTNYLSDKVQETDNHPLASATFFWSALERQVRVEGSVERVSEEESDAYFQSRPLGSRLGAWASPQSSKIESREWLMEKVEEYKKQFGEEEVERPEHWGGLRLVPRKIEFWQGASSRLHDRIVYEKQADGSWDLYRIAP